MEVSVKSIYRSAKWLTAVSQLGCCVLCRRWGVQAAHRNEDKGMGFKVDDSLTAALCVDCHHAIDNGSELTREERRALMDRAIVLTLRELTRRGLVVPK
ncbi:hypothetical protein SMW83_001003 [Cronobacter sakazakii]|nr:hypothetical protein [Cronobacter sakazakii]